LITYKDFLLLVGLDDWTDVAKLFVPMIEKEGPKVIRGLWGMAKNWLGIPSSNTKGSK
jgi:hypothetical protein